MAICGPWSACDKGFATPCVCRCTGIFSWRIDNGIFHIRTTVTIHWNICVCCTVHSCCPCGYADFSFVVYTWSSVLIKVYWKSYSGDSILISGYLAGPLSSVLIREVFLFQEYPHRGLHDTMTSCSSAWVSTMH